MNKSSLVRNVKRECSINGVNSGEASLLVAVSGGSDSTALVFILHELGFNFALAHCNFKLRGKESDKDEEFCRQLALHFNKYFFSISFETEAISEKEKIGIQEVARKLRYEWLEKIRVKNHFNFIATAHHADDQAETIIMNLNRGGGIRALKGIKFKNNKVIRPFLCIQKREIESYLKTNNINHRTDLSNFKTDYSRNKLRLEVFPKLAEINSNSVSNIVSTVSQCQVAFDLYLTAYNKWVQKQVKKGVGEYVITFSRNQKNVQFTTFLYEYLSTFGFNRTQFEQLLLHQNETAFKLISSSGYFLFYYKKQIVICEEKKQDEKDLLITEIPFINSTLKIIKVNKPMHLTENLKGVEIAQFSTIEFPLVYRKVRSADYFYPLGMNGKKKKVQKFLKDFSISPNSRKEVFVLETNGKIIWVVGFRLDERFKVSSENGLFLRLETNL